MDALLKWYAVHGRNLPWRHTTDPYAILVSECMLQQTQVDRVMPKYEAWIAAFPDWVALAAAPRQSVLKYWSGLGYNNRAVRLHLLAKLVVEEYAGTLPEAEKELIRLPGIGPYTAGAIRAFAFDKPGMFMDVNVERVLKRSHFTKRQRPGRKVIDGLLMRLQERHSPRKLGNALMDLGSIYCTASNPRCDACPLIASCKSKGERSEEHKLRIKKRQSHFEGSNRWWRGKILKKLVEGSESVDSLYRKIEKEAALADRQQFEKALAQLQEEGVIAGKRRLRIA